MSFNEFGCFELPLEMEFDEFKLSVESQGDLLIYHRKFRDEDVEKTLLNDQCDIIINPVEPVCFPKNITEFFMIELDKPVVVPPKSLKTIYTTFPIEIGIFVKGKNNVEMIDNLTFTKPKYTQYGKLTTGVISRYWKGEVFGTRPSLDLLRKGVFELDIRNITTEWMEVTKSVFSTFGMKIFYSNEFAYLHGRMRIMKSGMAETRFIESLPADNMTKSVELFTTLTSTTLLSKFVMEDGI